MPLTASQRQRSRELGLAIDAATAERLRLHGFHGAGFGCVARGMEPPRAITSALAVCVEEAAEPLGLAGDEAGERDDQAADEGGESGSHGDTITPHHLSGESAK